MMKLSYWWYLCLGLLLVVAACRQDARPHPHHTLTVINGQGSGEYEAGTVAEVLAESPVAGLKFLRWSGDSAFLDDYLAKQSILLMPEQDLRVVALFEDTTHYPLTVLGGSGSGGYLGGTEVQVVAEAPARGTTFDGWRGDTLYLSAADVASTTFLMPYAAAHLQASYRDLPRYALTVEQGSGTGAYLAGDTVAIVAEAPGADELFSTWLGDTAWLDDPQAADTWLVMPEQALALRATYEAIVISDPHTLTVTNGTGSGAYRPGETVPVSANPAPTGERFIRWGNQSDWLNNFQQPTTTLVMPDQAVTIEALYRDENLPIVSYDLDILPIFARSCFPGCHEPGTNYSDLTDFETVVMYADDIKSFVLSGYMPTAGALTDSEIALIVRWIDEGTQQN